MSENKENQFGVKAIIQLLSKIKKNLNNTNATTQQSESVADKLDAVISLLTEIKNKMKTILTVTQAEYDAIDPKDENTIYLIKEDENVTP